MTAPVVVTPDGAEWVARLDSARYGDVEIRLALNGSDGAEMRMTGTIRGTAIDLFSIISFPNPERVAVTDGSAGLLAGVYHTQLRAAFGSMTGKFVYTDNQGGMMSCTEGSWFIFATPR